MKAVEDSSFFSLNCYRNVIFRSICWWRRRMAAIVSPMQIASWELIAKNPLVLLPFSCFSTLIFIVRTCPVRATRSVSPFRCILAVISAHATTRTTAFSKFLGHTKCTNMLSALLRCDKIAGLSKEEACKNYSQVSLRKSRSKELLNFLRHFSQLILDKMYCDICVQKWVNSKIKSDKSFNKFIIIGQKVSVL